MLGKLDGLYWMNGNFVRVVERMKGIGGEVKIDSGCSRRVYLIGNWAIKVPHFFSYKVFLRGLLANITEASRYKRDYNPLLAKVLWSWAGLILIMERVKIMGDDGFETEEWYNMCNILQLTTWGIWFLGDEKPDNFGWRSDGSLVCVDYE